MVRKGLFGFSDFELMGFARTLFWRERENQNNLILFCGNNNSNSMSSRYQKILHKEAILRIRPVWCEFKLIDSNINIKH